jgi:Ca-activated chloride channel family protein
MLVADGGFGGVLEMIDHDVDVVINNGIAVTEVTQVFKNTEDRQVEALYTFPVPKGASVSNFSMWINGKEMVGEVLEKERAREIYNSYKRVRRDPGLLEQKDFKTFEMRIFPIAAQAEQRVQIAYYQELEFDHDWSSYTYPLATTAKPGLDQRIHGRFSFSLQNKSEVEFADFSSPSHRDAVVFSKHTPFYLDASLERHKTDLSRDIVLNFKTERARTGVDIIASQPKGEDGFFQMTLTLGKDLEKFKRPQDFVFVLDTSGSMEADAKMQTSTETVKEFLQILDEEDRFEIISFNSAPRPLFRELRPGKDEESVRRADDLLDHLRPGGRTQMEPALNLAYRYASDDRPLNVILISDGMTEASERELIRRLMSSKPALARVFAIGIGNEIDRPMLQQLANEAGGLAAFLSHGDDHNRQAKAFRRKLAHATLTNVKLDFPGGSVYDVEPAILPDIYHGQPVRIYGRFRDDAPMDVRLTGTCLGRTFTQTSQIDFSRLDSDNPEIERMWAWHRIQKLMETGGSARNTNEIVRLGEAFSIVTEYTSFLVLENDAEYDRWKIERRNLLRINRDRTEQARVRNELDRLRQEAFDRIALNQSTDFDAKKQRRDLAMAPQQRQNPAMNQAPATRQNTTRVRPPRPSQPQTQPDWQPERRRHESRGFDFNIGGGGGGGGALDPISAGLALALIGGCGARTVRRRKNEEIPSI